MILLNKIRNSKLLQAIGKEYETLRRSLRLIYSVAPPYAVATLVLTLLEALIPAGIVWLLKRVIDVVASATHNSVVPAGLGRTALLLTGAYVLVVCLQQALRGLAGLIQAHIHDLVTGQVTLRVMEKASAFPDLSPFEAPEFHDRLQLLQEEVAWRPMNLVEGLTQSVRSGITLLCMALFLGRFHPLLLVLLAITAGPSMFCQRRLQSVAWLGLLDVVPMRRRLANYAQILLTAPYAKEVRLFELADRILGRYQGQLGDMIGLMRQTRRRIAVVSLALSLLAALGVGSAFGYVLYQALHRMVTLGDLSLYTGALFQASGAAAGVSSALALTYESLPFMRELFTFLASQPAVPAGALKASSPRISGPPTRGLRLDSVAFRYPGTERRVFEDLSLEIPWGKATAIVGENGAGKSSLVKLLTRLYDPTGGRILLNGIDLREYDLRELRRQFGVVFQDFARYQLPVWENIGLGDMSHLDDRSRIREAARRSGADRVIRRLPLGEETMLGREFEGGVELSGGEWQTIALARAFMREAPILILDEPTSALDARAESEIYRRFVELAAGRTTLLISHRFSTVQMAQHILVLEGGKLVEEGDHRSLLSRGGRYAELYTLQTERYASDPVRHLMTDELSVGSRIG
jgi:ATP-binding cassette subfamily B protein